MWIFLALLGVAFLVGFVCGALINPNEMNEETKERYDSDRIVKRALKEKGWCNWY